MPKKRTRITAETEEVWIIRKRSGPVEVWCAGCHRQVRMVTVDEAAALAGESARSIYRRVEAGQLHYSEPPGRRLLICQDSLTGKSLMNDQAGGRSASSSRPRSISANSTKEEIENEQV